VRLQGIAAASGYAMGHAFIMQDQHKPLEKQLLNQEQSIPEVEHFEEKIQLAITELKTLQKSVGSERAKILETHILLLEDEELVGAAKDYIMSERVSAEVALEHTSGLIIHMFESMDDPYLRERSADVRDVTKRVMRLLQGTKQDEWTQLEAPVILFAHDLMPSDTVQLDRNKTAGFVTRIGGKTSHSAIIARSMEIPAIVGLSEGISYVKHGDFIILDGMQGIVVVDPSEELILEYKAKQQKFELKRMKLSQYKDKPSVTADGFPVELVANIGNPQEALAALHNGAEGIGLYRTELLYLGRSDLPTEEEQFQAYKVVAELFGKERPIIIRTLDIGGDKELPGLNLAKEMNPFLGFRAIRLCLEQVEIFKTQLRAILRASVYGNIKLMYPMISTLQELRQANLILNEVRSGLKQDDIPFHRDMEVGMMIEVPAAAMVADHFAREVDFFSIGTNDLIQYMMAADRMNEKVSYLSEPLNPAVLRLIHNVIEAAHAEGKWVGMCGEMAGSITAVPILLGMGVDELSMSAASILPIRALMHQLNRNAMQELASEVLQFTSADEIKHWVNKKLPFITEWEE
jgi:phosphotransferase system enzyme I (PtsI)